jgi:hypothetical protein
MISDVIAVPTRLDSTSATRNVKFFVPRLPTQLVINLDVLGGPFLMCAQSTFFLYNACRPPPPSALHTERKTPIDARVKELSDHLLSRVITMTADE